ncbi:hypothetical protein Sango_2944900 [Sesamum angolense]|uniref:Integrase catalytic domain-containing protein n=1 Tax=Sesamum angolense TaxID=2727404 RepID=A0AAE1VTZ2_9LAMI|nr:hypothetical protein Sango_2944900 [Sesamum angolense]
MQNIFDDMVHKNVECYVDDLVVKSKKQDMRKVFERLRRYQLKMNPSKCAFGVTFGKFLGFIVRQRGIEIEQSKIDAILRMPEPRNIHELKSLQGKLAYLRRFISNLAARCQPFSRLMKKDVPFQWDEACEKAFKSIKSYLMKLPVLVAPVPGRLLILYVAAQERPVGILLTQKNDEGKENVLYYLSRTMMPNELKYSPIEKLCLANPLKYVMAKPVLSDRLARCSNLGLEIAVDAKQLPLKVYGDSQLVVNQLLGDVELEHLPRKDNKQADALAKLTSTLSLTDKEARIPICPSHGTSSFWVCGAHQSGPELHFRIKRIGYYWPTMVKDCIDYARRCQACQFHANLIHQPIEPFHPTIASWLFDAWGLDVVGPWTKSSGGHLYILAATDYFSKWAEAVPLKEVKKENVIDFILTHIIYRYRVPRYIITDNGKPFCNSLIDKLCQKFDFKQRNSSMYYAADNGLAEAFNKTLCNLLKKVVAKSKRDWHERIGEALWAYRITVRTPTQTTPYALVYGVQAVLPIEQQIPSLRITIQEGLTQEENAKIRLEELEALDEKRLEAQQRLECYKLDYLGRTIKSCVCLLLRLAIQFLQ